MLCYTVTLQLVLRTRDGHAKSRAGIWEVCQNRNTKVFVVCSIHDRLPRLHFCFVFIWLLIISHHITSQLSILYCKASTNVSMVFLHRIATLAHCVFCYPPPIEDENSRGEDTLFIQRFRKLAEVFSYIDIANIFLDIVFCIKLIGDGRRTEAITLLIGIALAFLTAHLGGTLVRVKGGLHSWVPFCQSRRKYPTDNKLRLIFALVFTELAIFLFEDTATLLVFHRTTSVQSEEDGGGTEEEQLDLWDRANLCFTLLSAIVATVLLLLSLVMSINLGYFCSPTSEPNAPPMGWLAFTLALVCRWVSLILFLCLFLIVLGVVLYAILLAAGFLVGDRSVRAEYDIVFWFWILIMWIIGFYFFSQDRHCEGTESWTRYRWCGKFWR
mmetsp:Transcript_2374/g.3361  ORF Transcript_2374/g.3361 Transcript_2374/m.3361 type:complete len:384 (-) Transcript_2374:264-1415(-)